MKCLICNKEFNSYQGLSKHITTKHNFSKQDYYDKYYKQSDEGFCITCGKATIFLSISKGYQKHCSCKCAQKDPLCNIFITNNPQKNPSTKEKTKQTNLKKYGMVAPNSFNSDKFKNNMIKYYGVENPYQLTNVREKANCNSHTLEANLKRNKSILNKIEHIEKLLDATHVQKLLQQTKSSGWYQSNIVNIIKYNNYNFIKNSDIQKILDYDNNMYHTYSINEKKIVSNIESIYKNKIITNSRKIISPLELDIYLPDLNLAIEYNGIYFHSTLAGTSKEYHLKKSLLCREKYIRLIHIYEFENLNEQIELLKNLILGKDLYPQNDFNKNNLINDIPKPEILFNDNRLQIYGAGFLK